MMSVDKVENLGKPNCLQHTLSGKTNFRESDQFLGW